MKFLENIKLAEYTTFKIGGPARFFCIIKTEQDVLEAVDFAKKKDLSFFVLGGGSNLLVSDDGYGGLIMKNEIGGIEIGDDNLISNSIQSNIFKVGAGVVWDDFVKYSVDKGYFGIENLSAIPGVVGASPVQNIGAYGTEASNVIDSVRAFDTMLEKFVELKNSECQFDYRNSLFKKNKGRYIITRVDFVLSNNGKVNIEYKDLKEYFGDYKDQQIVPPTLQEVRNAVIEIRKNKLPDWKVWGTAGSFFKNPIVSKEKFSELKIKYPELPGFVDINNEKIVKVSLGWILDKVCNARGLVMGNARTYEKQALVLVSKPGATAIEITNLSKELMHQVKDKTGIDIEAEVEWVN